MLVYRGSSREGNGRRTAHTPGPPTGRNRGVPDLVFRSRLLETLRRDPPGRGRPTRSSRIGVVCVRLSVRADMCVPERLLRLRVRGEV